MSFLVDTYAPMEWYVQGNSRYEPCFQSHTKRYLTKLTLMEFYFQVYRRMGKEKAEKFYRHLKTYAKTKELTEEIIMRRQRQLRNGKAYRHEATHR